MSGTRRTRISRQQHAPFTPEALALFAELEATPWRGRISEAFKNAEHQLMRRLGLIDEFWTSNSVLDRSKAPPWPDHLVAFKDWHRVREIRLQLLEAVKLQAAE